MSKIADVTQPDDKERWVVFFCPGCMCSHSIPVSLEPYAGKRPWQWNGSLDKPTFIPSIDVNKSSSNPNVPHCHSYVTDGNIQFLVDCSHSMRGQTVELPEYEE